MTTIRVVTNVNKEEQEMLEEIRAATGFSNYKIMKKGLKLFYLHFKKSQKSAQTNIVHISQDEPQDKSPVFRGLRLSPVHRGLRADQVPFWLKTPVLPQRT